MQLRGFGWHEAGVQIDSSARVDWPKASTTSTGSVTKGSLQYSENIAHRVFSTTCRHHRISVTRLVGQS